MPAPFKPVATLACPKLHFERDPTFLWRIRGHYVDMVIKTNPSPPPAKIRVAATKADVTT